MERTVPEQLIKLSQIEFLDFMIKAQQGKNFGAKNNKKIIRDLLKKKNRVLLENNAEARGVLDRSIELYVQVFASKEFSELVFRCQKCAQRFLWRERIACPLCNSINQLCFDSTV